MSEQKKTKILKNLFNEVDPVGLIDFDTPESLDEYDPEIKELVSSSPDYSNLEELDKMLRDIFFRYFEGIELDTDLIRELAEKINEKSKTWMER